MAVGTKPQQKRVAKKKASPKTKKVTLNFSIDCTRPIEDGLMEAGPFEKFLQQRIKVDGKAGALKDRVTVKKDKTKIAVSARPPFSKRYLKYLTKKFLKKNNLRDWLHVVAKDKATYELKYYSIATDDDEEASE